MIHLNIKIFLYLTLLFLCVGCSYNYKKKPIENNNLGSIIINAKSLKVNKDFLQKTKISNNIKRINEKLLEEFEVWVFEKFELQGSENEAIVNIQIAEGSLMQTKTKNILKPFFVYEEEVFEVSLDFYLLIKDDVSINKKLEISSSIIFSLFDNMTLANREILLSDTIKKLIIKIDEKVSQDLKDYAFRDLIKTN